MTLHETATRKKNVIEIHYIILDDTVLTFAKAQDMP